MHIRRDDTWSESVNCIALPIRLALDTNHTNVSGSSPDAARIPHRGPLHLHYVREAFFFFCIALPPALYMYSAMSLDSRPHI